MPTANQYPGVDPWSPDPPEPKVPLDAYRRSFVEPEEEFVEPPEEVESGEMISQEPSTDLPSEPDEARVGDEDEQVTPSTDESTDEATIEELISKAEQAGDWLRSGQLKVERMSLQGNPSVLQGESDTESVKTLMAEIADAETNRDFYAAGLAKLQLVSLRAAANPSEIAVEVTPTSDDDQEEATKLELEVLDAEARGDWGESLRLKAQRIPGMGVSL